MGKRCGIARALPPSRAFVSILQQLWQKLCHLRLLRAKVSTTALSLQSNLAFAYSGHFYRESFMHWVVATWVPLSLKVKQLTRHSPEAASSIKLCNVAASSIKQSREIHLEEVYEEHSSQHPAWSGPNTFHSSIPFAFCTSSLQPQGLCTCCTRCLEHPFFT